MLKYQIKQITRYAIFHEEKMVTTEEYDEVIRVKDTNTFYVRKGDLWGIYDIDSGRKTDIKYLSITEFYDKTAIASELDENSKRQYLLINTELQIFPMEKSYEKIQYAENGLFITKFDSKFGVVDTEGNEIVACEYEYADNDVKVLGRQYVSLGKENGDIVLVDEKGNVYPIPQK